MTETPRHPRSRGLYALWTAIVVSAGLASRSEYLGLPPFFAKYAGNALWALMVFLGIGFVFPKWSTMAVAGMAAAVSCAVEVSQLCHAPWLDAARRTTLGHLALGDTFAWGDVAAYLVGIGVGSSAEWAARYIDWHRRDGRRESDQSEHVRGSAEPPNGRPRGR